MQTAAESLTARPAKGDEILWQPSDVMEPVHGYVESVGRKYLHVRWVEGVHEWRARLTLPLRDTHCVVARAEP